MLRAVVVMACAVAFAACGKKAPEGGAQAPADGASARPAQPVEVAAAFTDTVIDAIVATGQIEPMQQISLRPDVSGRVVELLFREGSTVARGTPLVKIDDAEVRAEVDRARAERDLAQQALNRTRDLLAAKAAAPADLERAEASARSTRATVDLLEVRLSRTVVRAPFAGVIGQRLVSLGDYVTTASELLTLQTVAPQRVVFTVPERYASALKRGQDFTFRCCCHGRTLARSISSIRRACPPSASRECARRIPGLLQRGCSSRRGATAVRASATVIPEESVSPTAAGAFVWVIQGDKATRREVELGVRTPGFVEVRGGIEPGDRVVVGGLDRLSEGAAVRATEVERRPKGAREG